MKLNRLIKLSLVFTAVLPSITNAQQQSHRYLTITTGFIGTKHDEFRGDPQWLGVVAGGWRSQARRNSRLLLGGSVSGQSGIGSSNDCPITPSGGCESFLPWMVTGALQVGGEVQKGRVGLSLTTGPTLGKISVPTHVASSGGTQGVILERPPSWKFGALTRADAFVMFNSWIGLTLSAQVRQTNNVLDSNVGMRAMTFGMRIN